jgi:peptidoglycan-associated lipoprotein
MFKKLVILAAVLALFSCQSKSKKDDFTIQDTSSTETNAPGTYQTLDNEQQAAELNRQTQAQVQEIEVQDRVFFSYDAFAISEDAKKVLDTQVAWLKSDPTIKVTVEGHCDERGTREYNIALGERRANSVKSYLVSNGIDESRIKTISYGKERPAFFGSSEDVFAKNRRAVTLVN